MDLLPRADQEERSKMTEDLYKAYDEEIDRYPFTIKRLELLGKIDGIEVGNVSNTFSLVLRTRMKIKAVGVNLMK